MTIESVAASKALQSLKEMDLDKVDVETIVPLMAIVSDELIAKVPISDDLWHFAAEVKSNLERRNGEILTRSAAKQFCQNLSVPPIQDCF